MEQINVKLVKSLIGCKKDQIATAHSLGLKKIGDFRAARQRPDPGQGGKDHPPRRSEQVIGRTNKEVRVL